MDLLLSVALVVSSIHHKRVSAAAVDIHSFISHRLLLVRPYPLLPNMRPCLLQPCGPHPHHPANGQLHLFDRSLSHPRHHVIR